MTKFDPCSRHVNVQLARKFPDIGQVRVDRMGNIIGGVNPFEDTNVKLEDQPHPEDQEVGANSANRTYYKGALRAVPRGVAQDRNESIQHLTVCLSK